MPDPFLLGGALLALSAGLGGGPMKAVTPQDAAQFRARARFPLPEWSAGYPPTVSDGYSATLTATHREHHGVDLMYHRRGGSAAPDAQFVKGSPNGTKLFFCPPGIEVRACMAGYLWATGRGGTGMYVTIDHGAPWATFYVHMESLLVPSGIVRGAGRVEVKAGQPIGLVGYSPLDAAKIRHLHFECWYGGDARYHVDPWPLISGVALP